MFGGRMNSLAAAKRSSERKEREDAAPRLRDSVPLLVSLHIDMVEQTGTSTSSHRKHVVVASAAALLEIPCGDKACRDGGHDITADVMRGLRQQKTQMSGEHACEGQTGSASCSRTLQYQTTAVFRRPDGA
jgi:hypothetical protein